MAKNVNTRIKLKHDTTANWDKATNFVPYAGELAIYSDQKLMKVGDGSTTITNLAFMNAASAYADFDGNVISTTYLKKSAVMSKGNSTTPVYFDSNGNAVALSYSINKTVPADAVFTDTNTTYTINTGRDNQVTLTGSNGTSYSLIIDNVAYAASSTFSYQTNWSGMKYDTYNLAGGLPVLDQLFEPSVACNRLAFIEPAFIKIEYSQDGGSTWTDSGYPDDTKRSVFGEKYGSSPIRIGTSAGNGTIPSGATDDQLMTRLDVSAPVESGWGTYARYSQINKLMLWASTSGHRSLQVQVQYSLSTDKTTFSVWRDWTYISGWNGPNSMSLPAKLIFASGQIYTIRFIFRIHEISSSVTESGWFGNIRLCGPSAWGQAAQKPYPYEWDAYANLRPRQISDNNPSLGQSSYAWKDLYLRDSIFFGNTNSGMRIINGSNYYATVNCANGMLWTFADGGNSSNRNLIPETDAAISLGTSSKRWSNVYVSGTLSDGTNSASVSELMKSKVPYISGSNVDSQGSQTAAGWKLIGGLSGDVYGKVFNIYGVSSAAGGGVLVSSSNVSYTNSYTRAAMTATASNQYTSVMVFVPKNTTYYFWAYYLSYYRVYSSTISLTSV